MSFANISQLALRIRIHKNVEGPSQRGNSLTTVMAARHILVVVHLPAAIRIYYGSVDKQLAPTREKIPTIIGNNKCGIIVLQWTPYTCPLHSIFPYDHCFRFISTLLPYMHNVMAVHLPKLRPLSARAA